MSTKKSPSGGIGVVVVVVVVVVVGGGGVGDASTKSRHASFRGTSKLAIL